MFIVIDMTNNLILMKLIMIVLYLMIFQSIMSSKNLKQ